MSRFFFYLVLLICLVLLGCGGEEKKLGRTEIINLSKGEKLVHVDMKCPSFWCLTRPFRPDEKPEQYTFEEKLNYHPVGRWEVAKYIIIESN